MNESLKDEGAEREAAWLSALLRAAPRSLLEGHAGLDAGQLERRARCFVREQLARCTDLDFGRRFHAACPVAGADARDYLQCVVPVGASEAALIGLRFFGGDVRQPFVDVIAVTAPWRRVATELCEAACAAYARFAPRRLRVFEADLLRVQPEDVVDQYFHAGWADEVAASGPSTPACALEVCTESDVDEVSALVEAGYADLAAYAPELVSRVHAAQRGALADCVETGVLAFITASGERVGVLGTAKDSERLFEGQAVIEEVLLRRHQGRGLAVAAQRLLAREVAARCGPVLIWGTIDALNHASRRTAERAGRAARAAWIFVSL